MAKKKAHSAAEPSKGKSAAESRAELPKATPAKPAAKAKSRKS